MKGNTHLDISDKRQHLMKHAGKLYPIFFVELNNHILYRERLSYTSYIENSPKSL